MDPSLIQALINALITGLIALIPSLGVYLALRSQNQAQEEKLKNQAQEIVQKGYQTLDTKYEKLQENHLVLQKELVEVKLARAKEEGIATEKSRIDTQTISDLSKRVTDLEVDKVAGTLERSNLLEEIKQLKETIVTLTLRVEELTKQLQASKDELAVEKASKT